MRAAFERLRAADQAAIAVFHDNVVEAFGELTPSSAARRLKRCATPRPRASERLAPDERGAGAHAYA